MFCLKEGPIDFEPLGSQQQRSNSDVAVEKPSHHLFAFCNKDTILLMFKRTSQGLVRPKPFVVKSGDGDYSHGRMIRRDSVEINAAEFESGCGVSGLFRVCL